MSQEPQKSNVLLIAAILGVIGTVTAATIMAIGNYRTEEFRQQAELTRIALVSLSTQWAATQLSVVSTLSAPISPSTETAYSSPTPYPTLTPYPTPVPATPVILFVYPPSVPTTEIPLVQVPTITPTDTLIPTASPTPTLRPCPAGVGPSSDRYPTGIVAGDYPPESLTQDQRQWLFEIFGNVGIAPVGYGGVHCQR